MSETTQYAWIIALTSAVALAAILVNRLSARLRVPAPIWMLVALLPSPCRLFPECRHRGTTRSSRSSQRHWF